MNEWMNEWMNAERFSPKAKSVKRKISLHFVSFSFSVLTVSIQEGKEEYHCGEDIVVHLRVENKSNEDFSVLINARGDLVKYTGQTIGRIAEEKRKVKVTKREGLYHFDYFP